MWVDQMLKYFFPSFMLIATFIIVPITNVVADKVMYCSEEISTGFIEDEGAYRDGTFQLDRYAIKVTDDYDEITIDDLIFDCRPSFDSNFDPHRITCFHDAAISEEGNRIDYGGLPQLFFYNSETNRFIYVNVSTHGYTNNGPDTESMSAGICEDF